MMKWRTISLLFVIILLSICLGFHGLVLAYAFDPQEEADMMRLELIHRHSPQLVGTVLGGPWPFKTRLERIKELVERDIVRHRVISHKRGGQGRLSTRRKDWETSAEMPMGSGADYGTGQYFVHVKIGKPARSFLLIADAGSELTWVNCRYGCGSKNCNTHRGRLRDHRRVYLADRSSSFETIPCSSKMCKIDLMNLFSLARCPTLSTPCAYDYSYLDGSAALGFFANDTITVGLTNGRKMMLENVLIGCTESTRGESFKGADGVLGLGFSKHSFATKAAGKFGNKFSYCLVDHLSPKNISNQLIFGTNRIEHSLSRNIQHTKLLLDVIPPFYAVNILGISIGGVMLRIPTEVWDASLGGGTILDSGSSLTLLAEPAYNPVMTALQMSVSIYKRLDIKPFEYCFNSTGFNGSLVQRLAFHFTDGARFEPPVKSYIIDVAPQSKCLGFVSVNWPSTSVIGNIMQQNNLWEFDLGHRTVSFAPSSCTCPL